MCTGTCLCLVWSHFCWVSDHKLRHLFWLQEYRLTYRVFDEKFANSATVVIKISDVNDNAPQFDRAEYSVIDVVEEDPDVSAHNPKFLLRVSLFDEDVCGDW